MEFLPLHRCDESVVKETAKLLNSEWPRSETARFHSLLSDCRDDLPCSLVLLEKVAGLDKRVIGHSRLSQVLGNPTAAIIESVIVVKHMRGCGLGREVMKLSESYALRLGYTASHLSTHDKCKFYERLGYIYCSPVSPARANARLLKHKQISALQAHFGENVVQLPTTKYLNTNAGIESQSINHVTTNKLGENGKEFHEKIKFVRDNDGNHSSCVVENLCNNNLEAVQTAANDCSTEVLNCLSDAPCPPPPPPPPPPPQMKQIARETIKSTIFWMMKEL